MQLSKVGLMAYFDGAIFSGHEMARSKPAPDVYLAAGATVWAYCPSPQYETALRQAGASHLFAHMAELPQLLAVS